MGASVVQIREALSLAMPIGEVWQALSNTQHVNQAVGFQAMQFDLVEGRLGLEAKTRFLGLPFNWEEMPFNWVEPRVFSVERVFRRSIVRTIVTGMRFTDRAGDHTDVELFADITPSGWLGRLAARVVVGRQLTGRWRRLCREIEQNYRAQRDVLFPAMTRPKVDTGRLLALASELRRVGGLDAALITRLVTRLSEAPDDEVIGMRPFAIADAWQAPRLDTLRMYLHATRLGLLDLEWEVLCPNCRVVKANYGTLSELRKQAHCEVCHINFDANFDEYVELRFTVNPRVRPTREHATYCVGGPFMTPHIKAQARVPAGAALDIALPLPAGLYRVRCRGLSQRAALHIGDEAESNTAALAIDRAGPADEELELRSAEDAHLSVTNQTGDEALLIVERDVWDNQGVSAAFVTALQEFRDLFSSEVLAPGLGIEIKTITLLFSDLKNSTLLYEQIGDSPAYAQVRDHFVALSHAIREHHGALVKTVGDAVMAVFRNAVDALQAGVDAQAAIARLNAAHPQRPQLSLKLGLHTGACIAINANNLIDYFGSAVNVASRAQGLSTGGDIIMAQAIVDDPQVAAILKDYPQLERFDATLKGLTPKFTLYRLWPLAQSI